MIVPGCVSVQNPAWSPDGKSLVLTDWRGGYNEAPARVITYDLDTGAIAVIAEGGTNVSQPGACWHETGGIIFSSDRWGDDGDQVSRWRDGQIDRLTHTAGYVGYEPTWAPNGVDFAYERHRMDEEGHGVIVRGTTPITSGGDCRQPCWSPDGQWIVFQRHYVGGWWLCLIHPDGSGFKKPLVPGTDATWHPDGRIVFSNEDGRLSLLDPASGKVAHIGPQDGYRGAPSISPDGRRVACEAFDGDPDGGPGTWLEIFDL